MGVHIHIKITVSPQVNMTVCYNKANILSPNSWPVMSVSLGYVKLEVICFTCFGANAVSREHMFTFCCVWSVEFILGAVG
jgi:hypothetical protein